MIADDPAPVSYRLRERPRMLAALVLAALALFGAGVAIGAASSGDSGPTEAELSTAEQAAIEAQGSADAAAAQLEQARQRGAELERRKDKLARKLRRTRDQLEAAREAQRRRAGGGRDRGSGGR